MLRDILSTNMANTWKIYTIFCGLVWCCASSLTITRVVVPRWVAKGDSAVLQCEWDDDGKQVYSLKWYLGLEEFYRWTPADTVQIQVFDLAAFQVDREKSERGRVVLHKLTRRAVGLMRCEVSEEAPSFHTDARAQRLEVVERPESPPVIAPLQAMYRLHQEVRLNCSSPRSSPPASLHFYINKEPVNSNWVQESVITEDSNEFPLYTSILSLRFHLLPRLVGRDGRVQLKCTAEIPSVYWQTKEVELPVDLPQRASIMEGRAAAPVAHGCPALVATVLPLLLSLLHGRRLLR